ncbi:hypothetical protein Tco_0641663 [Tanacetum coccineum]
MLDSYTSSMCVESWGRSSFARCLIEINANDVLKESLTMGVPLIDDPTQCPKKVSFPPTVVTPTVGTPTIEKTNDGFQTVGKKKKKKGKTKSTNGGQFGGHSVIQTVRYETKATTSVTVASNKEGNITMSNSYAALDDEREKDIENVYDESANLLHGTQTGESSSTFTVAAANSFLPGGRSTKSQSSLSFMNCIYGLIASSHLLDSEYLIACIEIFKAHAQLFKELEEVDIASLRTSLDEQQSLCSLQGSRSSIEFPLNTSQACN